MIHAYDSSYLPDVMQNLGAMLDYAVNSCGEDLSLFYGRFLRSGIPDQIERGNPRYLSGMSGVEMAEMVAVRTGNPLKAADSFIDMGSPEYWTGWTLAQLQWHYAKSFKLLQKQGVDAVSLWKHYSTLHEADISKSVSFSDKTIESNTRGSLLKKQRKIAHLTQKELATLSGTSLRAIRAYEQSQISLSNASCGNLLAISLILSCSPEELLG